MSLQHAQSTTYRYNPFEIAVYGTEPDKRTMLAEALFERLSETRSVAHVFNAGQFARGANPSQLSGHWLGPAGSLFVRNQLLDADLVLYESAEWPNAPTVVIDSDRTGLNADDWIPVILEGLAARTRQMPVYGLLLAGGRSRRMKQDKAALQLHGEPQLRHAYKLLTNACDRVYVSTRAGQNESELFADLPGIEDRISGIGPLAGILSAQMKHPNAAWLVMACDLPFVTPEVLNQLKTMRNPTRLATAYCSSRDALPEPMCAVYEPKSHQRLLSFMGSGVHCPRKILIESRTWLLDLSDSHALDNLNTPEDLAAARMRLERNEELSA